MPTVKDLNENQLRAIAVNLFLLRNNSYKKDNLNQISTWFSDGDQVFIALDEITRMFWNLGGVTTTTDNIMPYFSHVQEWIKNYNITDIDNIVGITQNTIEGNIQTKTTNYDTKMWFNVKDKFGIISNKLKPVGRAHPCYIIPVDPIGRSPYCDYFDELKGIYIPYKNNQTSIKTMSTHTAEQLYYNQPFINEKC